MGLPLGGLATALGLGFQGYGQDQATLLQRERQKILDQQNTQKFGLEQQLGQAQISNYASEAAKRDVESNATRMKGMANQRAYNALKTTTPDHPLAALPYDDTTDYTGELKTVQSGQVAATREAAKQRAYYNSLKAEFPNHPLVAQGFDANNPADYAAGLADAREQRKLDITNRQKDHFTFPTGVNADGKPMVYRGNTATGELTPTDVGARNGGVQGGGASAQAQQARLMAAVSEARLADERMRAYEDNLLSGKTSITPLQQAAGSLTTNLADSHGVVGALTQAGSEFGLNKADPDYAQYLRDASTIGRAEQMMSPRGGNETMVRANALLSRAGTGAMKNTIDASRMARQALFGVSGGIEQTLSPEQSQKLQQGLVRIKAGEHGGNSGNSGNIDLGKPPLAQRVQELKAHGLSKDAARVQLQHEGYDLSRPNGGDE